MTRCRRPIHSSTLAVAAWRLCQSILLFLLCVAPAFGASHDGRPKVLLHARPHQGSPCQRPITDCQQAVTAGQSGSPGSAPSYDVFVLLERGFVPRPARLRFGMSYQENCSRNIDDGIGLDILSWTGCLPGHSAAGRWPEPGSFLDVLPGCPPASPELLVIGSFYLSAYSPDSLRLDSIPGSVNGSIESCSGPGYDLVYFDFGSVVFTPAANVAGCNPCVGRCPDIPRPIPPPDCRPPPPPPPPPPAGPGTGDVLLHLVPAVAHPTCQSGALADCRSAATAGRLATGDGPFYHVYLLGHPRTPVIGIAGLQCGIEYDGGNPGGMSDGAGIDIYAWTPCADLQFPYSGAADWPMPRSGNLLTWASTSHCQTGNVAVAGYFYVGAYDAGRLRVMPHPADGLAKLADCQSAEIPVSPARLGWVDFSASGTPAGCNPCLVDCEAPDPPVVTVQTTWSSIKAMTTGSPAAGSPGLLRRRPGR